MTIVEILRSGAENGRQKLRPTHRSTDHNNVGSHELRYHVTLTHHQRGIKTVLHSCL